MQSEIVNHQHHIDFKNNSYIMKKNPNTKLKYISFLQSFGIILVVLGHSYALGVPIPHFAHWIRTFIYSFHMPLFMCMSGYLFIYTESKRHINIPRFIYKKSVRLLLPYVVISSVLFLPKLLLSKIALNLSGRNLNFDFKGYFEMLIYPRQNVLGHFWFLPTLFIIFIFSIIISKFIIKSTSLIIITSIVALSLNIFSLFNNVNLLGISDVSNLFVYFWLGCLIAKYQNKFDVFLKLNYLAPVLLLLLILFQQYHQVSTVPAIIGIFMSFALSYMYSSFDLKIFKRIDGYSYSIYLLSWPFQAVINILVFKILHLGWYFTFIGMFTGGILLPVILTKLIIKYVPSIRKIIGQ